MIDEQGNNIGYFDKPEWMTHVMTLPRQHRYYCDENQAEQMLQGLLNNGMIEEFEPRRYRPTEKLRETS